MSAELVALRSEVGALRKALSNIADHIECGRFPEAEKIARAASDIKVAAAGKPCRRFGHYFGRTADGHCIECERLRGLGRYHTDPEYREMVKQSAARSRANKRIVKRVFSGEWGSS